MRARVISARDSCDDPNGIVNDSVEVIAEQVGAVLVSFSPTRCGHGVSSIRLSPSVQVKGPAPGKKPAPPPSTTCEVPPFPSQAQYTKCPDGSTTLQYRYFDATPSVCDYGPWESDCPTHPPCVEPSPLELANYKICSNNTEILQRRTFNNADNVCAYPDWDSDCPAQPACNQPNPLVLTQVVDCVATKMGKMTQTRIYDNTPGFCDYGAWVDGTCSQAACVKPMPEALTQTIDCAKGTGSQLQTRTILETAPGPGTCPYSEWANSGSCTCPGSQTFNTTFGSCSCQPPLLEDVACPAPRNVGTARKVTSYSGAACTASTTLNVDQCACPADVTTTVNCTGGQTGRIKTVTSFSGGACVPSEEITNTCACSGGRTFNGSACVCTAGKVFNNATGQCEQPIRTSYWIMYTDHAGVPDQVTGECAINSGHTFICRLTGPVGNMKLYCTKQYVNDPEQYMGTFYDEDDLIGAYPPVLSEPRNCTVGNSGMLRTG